MMNFKIKNNHSQQKEVRKPFLTGSVTDERTIRNCLKFFGTILIVFFVAFIACASATFDNRILRVFLNSAVIILVLIILFNNGSRWGTDDVARGEILYQKKEKGSYFADSERRLCFHPMKGYLTGLIGTIPILIPAILLAVNTSVQMTESGMLPSWMQAYVKRSDIGNALINYTQPEGMQIIDYLRTIVRISILPFVNIVGSSDKNGLVILERLSPLILILPAAAYGTGYLSGRSIRTQIHTAISENNRKRIRREQKKRKARNAQTNRREPEQLN